MSPSPYDPWRDLATRWPLVQVVVHQLPGDLLGVLHGQLIVLRAGTSIAQQRSTLTHEIVHLDRGVTECGPGSRREEHLVEAEAARRLITVEALSAGVRELGNHPPPSALAALLDVDSTMLQMRLATLSAREQIALAAGSDDLFAVA